MVDPTVLLRLARDNLVTEIEAIVASGIRPDVCNQMGQTGLHIAALWGNVEAAAAFLRLGVDVNLENTRGSTPLHFAASAKANTRQMCKLLLAAGAHTDTSDKAGRVPYELAVDDAIRLLLGGPDMRIFACCAEGKAQELQAVLGGEGAQGPGGGKRLSVRVMDAVGRTPLNICVLNEHLDCLKVVVQHDPSTLTCPDAQGQTPLHCAVATGNLDILRHLLSLSTDCINVQSLHPSEYASGNWLLNGEEVEPLDRTPLAVAVELGDVPIIQELIAHGARLDIPDFDGRLPLHMAVEEGDVEVAAALLEAGANPNARSQDLVTCLHHTSTKGPLKLLELLLAAGADPAATNDDGWTPLHLAARAGKADRAALLLNAGAAVGAANTQGNTALHLAAVNGHVPVIQLLREHGAALDVRNKEGRTPWDCAKTQPCKDALDA